MQTFKHMHPPTFLLEISAYSHPSLILVRCEAVEFIYVIKHKLGPGSLHTVAENHVQWLNSLILFVSKVVKLS